MNGPNWKFASITARPDLKIGAAIHQGQLMVHVFDAGSDDSADSDPICNVEAVCAEAMVAAINAAKESA